MAQCEDHRLPSSAEAASLNVHVQREIKPEKTKILANLILNISIFHTSHASLDIICHHMRPIILLSVLRDSQFMSEKDHFESLDACFYNVTYLFYVDVR